MEIEELLSSSVSATEILAGTRLGAGAVVMEVQRICCVKLSCFMADHWATIWHMQGPGAWTFT